MTDEERAKAIVDHLLSHRDEWESWNSKPKAERRADLDKIEATAILQGPGAGRQMMRALGIPLIPDELCEPLEALDSLRNQGEDELITLPGLGQRARMDH